MPERRWTISVLTIPSRERYLQQLVDSLADVRALRRATLSIVYNRDSRETPARVESGLRRALPGVPFDLTFNTTDPSIVAGRQAQLNACRTPHICFLDDDLTVHGDLLDALDEALCRNPLGIVGIPSRVGDTDERFKPRDSTPSIERDGVRYMSVQGMLVAGYRRLLLDVGGFNPRREFWGEWTELNLRLWRSGFPTGYVMDGPYLRHWHDAPESPTRNRCGRELDILWGLMCTALEYDAVSATDATADFWRLTRDRYLAYAFGASLSPEAVLQSCLQLVPRLTREWARIAEFRELVRGHRFDLAPFASLRQEEIDAILTHARSAIAPYREPRVAARSMVRRLLPRRWAERTGVA
jgi:hypothetical protein